MTKEIHNFEPGKCFMYHYSELACYIAIGDDRLMYIVGNNIEIYPTRYELNNDKRIIRIKQAIDRKNCEVIYV